MSQKKFAAGKILRRCTICRNFHASYLVDDPKLGKCYLCYSCWKARQPKDGEEISGDGVVDEKKTVKKKNNRAVTLLAGACL